MSTLCCFRCFSLSFSINFRLTSSSASPVSFKRNPPLELTILDKSYSKHVPSLESRFRGLDEEATGCVGEPCPARVTINGRLLCALIEYVEQLFCSSSRCAALAKEVVSISVSSTTYTSTIADPLID